MRFFVLLVLAASTSLVNGAMQRVVRRHHWHHPKPHTPVSSIKSTSSIRKTSTVLTSSTKSAVLKSTPSQKSTSSSAVVATITSPPSTIPTSNPTAPVPVSGAVGVLNPVDVAQSQQRDPTAIRAFSSVSLKSASGQCLFIDPTAGDFRENLIPVAIRDCSGSPNELFDIITSGIHNNIAGQALVVSSLTQGCLNFDPRRAVGDQVILFSCGGRADGTGAVTNSQLFPFVTGATSILLAPENQNGATCLVPNGSLLDQAPCSAASDQSFSIFTLSTSASSSAKVIITRSAVVSIRSTTAQKLTSFATVVATTTSPPSTIPTSNPTAPVPVSGAVGVLNPVDVAQSQQRDPTAIRAFSSVSLKSASGQCLFIDPTAGDFRENLIPVAIRDCSGSPNELFDIITSGIHNNIAGQALVVSSLTQGCLNFDPRRAVGDQVILFSCGGRADGTGAVTNSQLFPFVTGATSILLAPENQNGATCLVPNGALLDTASCSATGDQLFSIV